MTKQQFIEASVILAEKMAGELYDNYMGSKADPADLYTREQMANDAEGAAVPEVAPLPKLKGPYKARKSNNGFIRLSNMADHYGISSLEIYKVCEEAGIKYTRDAHGHGLLAAADLDFLNQYIGRKYNYFNK